MLFQEKSSLVSKLSIDELRTRLNDNLETGQLLHRMSRRFKKNTKKYEGEMVYNKFRINRIIRYRNNFLPFIDGEFVPRTNGSVEIRLDMRPHRLILVFLAVLAIFIIAIGFKTNEWFLSAIILIVFPLGLAGFKYETKKAKKDFIEIFEAKILR